MHLETKYWIIYDMVGLPDCFEDKGAPYFKAFWLYTLLCIIPWFLQQNILSENDYSGWKDEKHKEEIYALEII